MLLTTRCSIPPARANLVQRVRLIKCLDMALHSKLTLICAPAGFGKTTLVSAWLAQRSGGTQASGLHPLLTGTQHLPAFIAAWISLDLADNDPIRFWNYVIAALDRAHPGIGATALTLLQSLQPPSVETVLTVLLNALSATPGNAVWVLVLDDYHLITTPAIHTAMLFLLEHMPAQMHLIIISRSEPPLMLARWRARGQLVEVRANDLRFTHEEAAAFLNQVMDLDLTEEDVSTLAAHTEGWIVALHLVALSLRDQTDSVAVIRNFTGNHRYIVDYLTDEVFHRQTPEIQDFLLQTAILDQLCAALCAVLLDVQPVTAQMQLEKLEHTNLFLVALDNQRQWYRYHHLFADFLRTRLQQTRPERLAALHQRAAMWYEQQGMVVEALRHALAAADFGQATRLIEQAARPMLMRSEAASVLLWLQALPPVVVCDRAELSVIYAWALAATGQLADIETHLQHAEHCLATYVDVPDPEDRARLQAEIMAIRAVVASIYRDLSRVIRLARPALDTLPPDQVFLRGTVALVLGLAYHLSGELGAAEQVLFEAHRLSQTAGNLTVAVFALHQLAELQVLRGHLRQAAAIYQQVFDGAFYDYCFIANQLWSEQKSGSQASMHTQRQPLPVEGMAYVGAGRLCYEWNDLTGAVDYLTRGIELGQQGHNVEILLRGHISLAWVKQARGDTSGAHTVFQVGLAIARATQVPRLVDWVAAEQARWWVIQGNLGAASHWLQERGLGIDDELIYLHEVDYLTLVRILMAQGQLAPALHLLERLLQAAEHEQRTGSVIEILVHQALAWHTHDQPERALTALQRALSLAEPEGYIRTFVDGGPAIAVLLRQLPGCAYHTRLLKAFVAQAYERQPEHDADRQRAVNAVLVEPLSPRELTVLRLIAEGLSNQEIAAQLVVALSTVKKHINNIYSKLDARSRTQAIARARALDLL